MWLKLLGLSIRCTRFYASPISFFLFPKCCQNQTFSAQISQIHGDSCVNPWSGMKMPMDLHEMPKNLVGPQKLTAAAGISIPCNFGIDQI